MATTVARAETRAGCADVHIVLRPGPGSGSLFTDSARGAHLGWLPRSLACSPAALRRHRIAPSMLRIARVYGQLVAMAIGMAALAGCTAPGLILTATGIATDTSVTWDIVKHVHGQLTENDATPCTMLNSVQRALNARCTYVAGSIRAADIAHSGLQGCPLTAATQDVRLWRALPELIEKGALSERCPRTPLQDLAEVDACPDFQSASPEVIQAFVYLAESDPRAIR